MKKFDDGTNFCPTDGGVLIDYQNPDSPQSIGTQKIWAKEVNHVSNYSETNIHNHANPQTDKKIEQLEDEVDDLKKILSSKTDSQSDLPPLPPVPELVSGLPASKSDLSKTSSVEQKISWNGGYYVGECSNGKPHGKGVWSHPDGRISEGGFIEGVHVNGKFKLLKGESFVGECDSQGNWSWGKYTFSSGNSFEGEWKAGRMFKGIYRFNNGQFYQGEFNENAQYHGYGELTYTNGYVQKGYWVNGVIPPAYLSHEQVKESPSIWHWVFTWAFTFAGFILAYYLVCKAGIWLASVGWIDAVLSFLWNEIGIVHWVIAIFFYAPILFFLTLMNVIIWETKDYLSWIPSLTSGLFFIYLYFSGYWELFF